MNYKSGVILILDTSNREEVTVGLRLNKKEFVSGRKVHFKQAQVVLPMIDDLLKKHNVSLKEITSVIVNTKSGSYTGIRVGMAIANALSFALEIPVRNK